MLVLEHGIRQVDSEDELEETKAQSDGTVLAAQCLERGRVENLAPLSELSLSCHRVDIVRAVDKKALVAPWPGVLEQALLEPMSCE